jgi:hypothetical protein
MSREKSNQMKRDLIAEIEAGEMSFEDRLTDMGVDPVEYKKYDKQTAYEMPV